MQPTRRRRPVSVEMPSWGIFVFESHHDTGFRMAMARAKYLTVLYLLEGAGEFATPGRRVAIRANDVVVVPKDTDYQIRDAAGDPLSLYAFCVAREVADAETGLAELLPAGRLPRNELLAVQVRDALRRLLYEQTLARPACGSVIRGITLQLLGLLARTGKRTVEREGERSGKEGDLRRRVEQYVAELDRRFFEPADLDQVARSLGMSRRRFTDLFRRVAGRSWLDAVRTRRIAHAQHLLAETGRSIVAIAFECGFEDLSSFYRVFKAIAGATPQQWRSTHGKD